MSQNFYKTYAQWRERNTGNRGNKSSEKVCILATYADMQGHQGL